ncbi:unnamed protein product [Hyaloperonospora brassicae]|uniref:WD repeat-containing protein 4 homolog n=1 Tax=Hyaloperonospora brassicae TaxID=162125 RepID=A0AAV0T6G2_HYABA|nr:unnamed protein product [Hyaloperonospora brassicae]
MVQSRVFTAAAHDVVVTVRDKTVFALPVSTATASGRALQFTVLQSESGADEASEAARTNEHDNDENKDKKTAPSLNIRSEGRITAMELFRPLGSDRFALLLLVNERRLLHYELNLPSETLVLKASRLVPRSATCMTVGHLKLDNQETKYIVVLGQKTGEAVGVPFPDLDRDLRTLLGHTTSMITDVATNHDSSLLLTADRDEKMRVSRFPNAAIIESYCLGHKASLTKVACSIVTPELVVSASMDNTLKLWNMKTGTLLASETLLLGVEVSHEPLDEGADADDDGRKAANSLLKVSLAISPKTNIVAVLVNCQHARFFEIVSQTLQEVVIPIEDLQLLLMNEPCELLYLENDMLVVSYKKDPFVQLFSISLQEKKLEPVEPATDVFKDLRNAAAAINLNDDDEENTFDVLENGMIKKKARTSEWNTRASAQK